MTRRAGPEVHRRLNVIQALADGEVALRMYYTGTPWRVVAQHLGVSPSTARRRGLLFRDYKPPVPEPRHLVPAMRCTRRRSNGKPCSSWAIRGGWVCWSHGGAAPQVRAAAARRVAELEAEHDAMEAAGHPSTRAFHHELLKLGAHRGSLFIGADRRRWERTQRRHERDIASHKQSYPQERS